MPIQVKVKNGERPPFSLRQAISVLVLVTFIGSVFFGCLALFLPSAADVYSVYDGKKESYVGAALPNTCIMQVKDDNLPTYANSSTDRFSSFELPDWAAQGADIDTETGYVELKAETFVGVYRVSYAGTMRMASVYLFNVNGKPISMDSSMWVTYAGLKLVVIPENCDPSRNSSGDREGA